MDAHSEPLLAAVHTTLRRRLVAALIASLCAGACVAIFEILKGGEFDETAAKAVTTTMALMLYSLCGIAASRLADRRPALAWFTGAQLVLFACAFAASLVPLWITDGGDAALKTAAIFLFLSVGAAQSSLLLTAAKRHEALLSLLVRRATLVIGSIFWLVICAEILFARDETNDWKALGVVGVLFVLGNALLPLVRRLNGGA